MGGHAPLVNFCILEPLSLVLRLFLGHLNPTGLKSGVALTHDFGRYTCVQYRSPPRVRTVHKVIDNMVWPREGRKQHHSMDASSYTTMFNFADANAQVGYCPYVLAYCNIDHFPS